MASDNDKPRLHVISTLQPVNGRMDMAATLERIALQLRKGEVVADQGVLVLRNGDGGLLHAPIRLGSPSCATELMGLLSYAEKRIYDEEIREP